MRVVCCTKRTTHLFGDVNPYADQARVRYADLREDGWDVAYFHGDGIEDGWEEDEYDTSPNTEYLVCYDGNDAVGVVRLLPTDEVFSLGGQERTFMLRDVFTTSTEKREALVTHEALDELRDRGHFIEGTRFVLDPCAKNKLDIISHLTVATIQRGYDRGAHSVVCLMAPKIWKSFWGRRGCPYTFIGEEVDLGGSEGRVRVATLDVSGEALTRMKEITCLEGMVLDKGSVKLADRLQLQNMSEDCPAMAKCG